MFWNTTLVVGMSLLFVSGSSRPATAARDEADKDVQAALAKFKEQAASTPIERDRIRPGEIVFKKLLARKLSGRGPRGELLHNPGADDRLGWKEIVKLLGRPDSVYEVPITSHSVSLDRPEAIDKAFKKNELPFPETGFWYRLGQDSVGAHALFFIFENGVLRKVQLTFSTR
jgi:hypothetical protein